MDSKTGLQGYVVIDIQYVPNQKFGRHFELNNFVNVTNVLDYSCWQLQTLNTMMKLMIY